MLRVLRTRVGAYAPNIPRHPLLFQPSSEHFSATRIEIPGENAACTVQYAYGRHSLILLLRCS